MNLGNHYPSRRVLSLCVLIALFCCLRAPAYAAGEGSAASFQVASSITLENSASLVTADFNGDGHLDFVTANSYFVTANNYADEILILFGRGGAEGFGPPMSFPTNAGTAVAAARDFNGDGKLDLLTVNSVFGVDNGSVSVLLGDGSGRFGEPRSFTLPGDPYLPIISDFNNDGKLDLVTQLYTGTTGGALAILLGDGTGGFTQAPNSPLFPNNYSATIAVGDFNEDGNRDIAVPDGIAEIDILLGDGTGRFPTSTNNPLSNVSQGSIVEADFNNDGHLDILHTSNNSYTSGTLQLLLGNGQGNLTETTQFTVPQSAGSPLVGDLNGDGKLDLALPGLNALGIILGDGAGGFTYVKTYSANSSSGPPVSGDFNEDGKVDLAVPGIEILYATGSGAFAAPLHFGTSVSRPRALITADFNSDGKQDFATVSGDSSGGIAGSASIGVALGDGSGKFTAQPLIRFFAGTHISAIATADFNHDGKLDLAATLSSRKVAVIFGDGTGAFPTNGFDAPTYSTAPWGATPTAIKVGDFNNDDHPDLIVTARNNSACFFLRNDGIGVFTVNRIAVFQGTSFFEDVAIADFNGDNKLDVALSQSGQNSVFVLQGDGNGFFASSATLSVPGTPISLLAGDFNGDGKPDLAASNSAIDPVNSYRRWAYVSVMLNNGTNGFSNATNYLSEGAGLLAKGDFNGDGKTDLAVSSGRIFVGGIQNGVSILSGDGTGGFGSALSFSAGSSASDYLAVSDFNGDGKDDVLYTQPGSYSVALLINNFSAALPCLSVNDVTVTEGDAGTTDVVFTVKLSAASAQSVRVNYYFETQTLYGEARAKKGVDFADTPGTLTFLPGVTTQTVTVPVNSDAIDEFDETFYLKLLSPINALVSDERGAATIIDNDATPSISINDAAVVETTLYSNNSAVTFTVSLSAASEKPIDVQYAASAGTATAGTDYYNITGTVEFPAGTTSKTIAVPVIPDNVYEPNETFFVNLSAANNATIADEQGLGTITNDDPLPGITAATVVYWTEGSAGTSGTRTIEVRLSNPSSQTITVAYATANETATAGSDYVATSGSLTFNPGEITKNISVSISGDNMDETDETFFLNFSNPTNATITVGQALFTIFDDDGPILTISDTSVTEGNMGTVNANFAVTLSAASPQSVSISYATVGGTATSNVDYVRVTSSVGSLTIPAGATSGTITIRVNGDYQIEPDETFLIALSSIDNGSVTDSLALCTIINDDAPGSLQFSASGYNVNEGGGSATISVSRTGGGGGVVSVDFATANGSAIAGSDYVATSGTLTFNQGELTKTFTVPLLDDTNSEADETLSLILSNPTGGATLGSLATSQLTIQDDESSSAAILQFDAANFTGSENSHSATISVSRAGDTASAVSVDYVTSDGTAKQTSDYTVATGTLDFAAGETSKTFTVLITDNAYVDGDRTVNLALRNATNGGTLGSLSAANLTITDNDTAAATTNPIDEAQFFIRQNYADFLSREPDQGGLAYWTERITQCGDNLACVNFWRSAVSAAFFIEQEFQSTGSFVYRFSQASYGARPAYSQFMLDRARVVDSPNLEQNKQAFAELWVQRPEFIARYGQTSSCSDFTDALIATASNSSGVDLAPRRSELIGECNVYAGDIKAQRSRVLRKLVELPEFVQAEYNKAFVLMQYFGFLKRDPDEGGYQFWLGVVNNSVPNDPSGYRSMVCAFITSPEYQQRFSPIVTRNDAVCAPQ